MGLTGQPKVMQVCFRHTFITVVMVFSITVGGSLAFQCQYGKQYWDSARDSCIDCTNCSADLSQKLFLIRPCDYHRDTECGPISRLQIDWSWLPVRHNKNRHHHRGDNKHARRHETTTEATDGGGRMVWHFAKPDDDGIHSQTSTETAFINAAERLTWNDGPVPPPDAPFTDVEEIVWDWQAIVLALAVCACILFFVVAAAYSVHHARQWKRLKDNFDADVEELSARLTLMVATGQMGELEPNMAPINDGNYHNNCVYLEQLLVRKDDKISQKSGNVYIEDGNANHSNTNTMSRGKL